MLKYCLSAPINAYKHQLEAHPLRTKMATSTCLFSIADFICQKTEAKMKARCEPCQIKEQPEALQQNPLSMLTKDWDRQRTLRFSMMGGLILCPGIHFFLTRFMSKMVFPSYSNASNIFFRVCIHQAFMMPFVQFTLLFASAAFESAGSFNEKIKAGQTRFSEKWRTGFSASMMYWPFVNAVMYSAVQPRFYNIYLDCSAMLFASVMSYITYNDCSSIVYQKTEEDTGTNTATRPLLDKSQTIVSTITQINQMHLLKLMHDGKRVEAQEAQESEEKLNYPKIDDNWLLSTQT